MSEVKFGKLQSEIEFNGVIDNDDKRASFHENLSTMVNLVLQYDREYYGEEDIDPSVLFENYSPLTPDVMADIFHAIPVDGDMVSGEIDFIIDYLDSADNDDAFGTEGWRYHLGWV